MISISHRTHNYFIDIVLQLGVCLVEDACNHYFDNNSSSEIFSINAKVSVTRNVEMKGQKGSFQAVWLKNFHVSPFMEMDYK